MIFWRKNLTVSINSFCLFSGKLTFYFFFFATNKNVEVKTLSSNIDRSKRPLTSVHPSQMIQHKADTFAWNNPITVHKPLYSDRIVILYWILDYAANRSILVRLLTHFNFFYKQGSGINLWEHKHKFLHKYYSSAPLCKLIVSS